VIELEVEDGVARVTKGSFASEAVEVEVSGDITLKEDLLRSRADLEIVLKLSDAVDKMARLAPMMSRARDDDGTYHLSLVGSLNALRFREDRTRSAGATVGGARDLSRGTLTTDSEDRDEAREKRLERIRERRARMTKDAATEEGSTESNTTPEPPTEPSDLPDDLPLMPHELPEGMLPHEAMERDLPTPPEEPPSEPENLGYVEE
jgi:hypothetical protein